MRNSHPVASYKNMSAEDQHAFDRWLKANAVVGSLLAAGLVAMALAGSNALGPQTAAAKSGKAVHSAMADRGPVLSPYELMTRMPYLPTEQVDEPF